MLEVLRWVKNRIKHASGRGVDLECPMPVLNYFYFVFMGLDGDENVKDEEQIRSEIAERINKLQLEVDEQMQIR